MVPVQQCALIAVTRTLPYDKAVEWLSNSNVNSPKEQENAKSPPGLAACPLLPLHGVCRALGWVLQHRADSLELDVVLLVWRCSVAQHSCCGLCWGRAQLPQLFPLPWKAEDLCHRRSVEPSDAAGRLGLQAVLCFAGAEQGCVQ